MTGSRSDTAIVFPGQGSQRPGMGAALYEAWPEARALLDELDGALPIDLVESCFEADERTLRATELAQPAVFGVGIAAYRGLLARSDVDPAFVAGHSLGHVTALAASGALDPVDGVRLVRERGRIMSRAARDREPGVMLAVLLADPDLVVEQCSERPDVGVAAFNAPHETVISGTAEAVEDVRDAIGDAARARFRKLDTADAFHSPLMTPALEEFDAVLEDAPLTADEIPAVSDVSAEPYADPDVAREELSAQIVAPVDWVGVIRTLRDRGVERYVELPPAGTLGRLIERIDPDAAIVTLDDPGDVTGTI